ncbi:nitrate reductase [Aurantimonas sp. Leaf443]|nr:nitrate reductase [Aurantimonas sp. Leaf443]
MRTTCPYCGVGCGVLATPQADGRVAIAGDPAHPANFGRLCSKGSALGETLGLEERLLHPRVGGRRATWDEALGRVAGAFSAAIAEHGPESVAFYVSGQLLTEDYYVANKLMKGFIGAANIDTNSRLCMSSSVAGHVRAFGSDTVPGTYEDLECADLVVLVGSNLAWCHPVLYQRLAAARAARPRMRIVLVDPRRTATADLADLHLAIAPDGDAALFAGLLHHLHRAGAVDEAFVARHTNGYAEALAAAGTLDPDALQAATGLGAAEIEAFYALFAATETVVTVYSQGVNQSVGGTDKVNAILNCHLATGRIGRPGMGPFSVTGQPNAMGGREVGGLANMLAAHLDIADPADRSLVQTFWNAPTMARAPGLKAVDLFSAVASGRIRALWIMGTNPVVSMPDADAVRAALAACPFVAVSDVSASADTVALAHVALPAAAWGEKDGTVTNSERRISRQRPFLPAPGEARPDWRIVCDVAARMGFGPAFAFASAAEVFDEHARLTAQGNGGSRDLDLGGLAGLEPAAYDRLDPVQWPVPREAAGAPPVERRFFGQGGFFHADGRARFVSLDGRAAAKAAEPGEGLFTLNTGRVRDHWHTMTRTGLSARLSAHIAEPYCEIHPDDARDLELEPAGLVRLTSPHGTAVLRCLVSDRQRRGSVFAPMHWSAANSSHGRVDALVAPRVDPVSGQPGLKASPVRLAPFGALWHGFAVCRERPGVEGLDYFALARAEGGWRLEAAGRAALEDPDALAADILGVRRVALSAYRDGATGTHRFAAHDDEGRLVGALFLSRGPVAVSRRFAAEALLRDRAPDPAPLSLLAGRDGAQRPDPGAIVCSCFSVGVNEIAACASAGASSVQAVGAALKAGTNCGSCRSEIAAILARAAVPEPA